MSYDKFYKAIEKLEEYLDQDLVGPVMEDEIIDENPCQYYAAGILYPEGTEIDEAQAVEEGTEYDEDEYDINLARSNSYNPSTMAITTTLVNEATQLRIKVKSARYEPLPKEGNIQFINDEEKEAGKGKFEKQKWRRIPLEFEKVLQISNNRRNITEPLEKGLNLYLYIHKVFKDNSKMITIALVNNNPTNKSALINNENSFFQCSMELSAADNIFPIFIEKKMQLKLKEDKEVKNLRMLYNHVKNYAVGHGCAVKWEEKNGGALKITSTFIPKHELKQMKPAVRLKSRIFKMEYLSKGNKNEICNELKELSHSYDEWINEQRQLSLKLPREFEGTAGENLSLCDETRKRLDRVIELFLQDDNAFKAFQLANEAMLLQRIRTLKRKKKEIGTDKITWYPFQLAFMLQELAAIIDPNDKYRNIVDLLWFPTGGGKTEAYLGISAFTIFLRRLRNPKDGGGVTIIMRYTLRLLTIQQFERAAALICACETIRKREGIGKEEISIGLWVGGGLTPNNIKDTEEKLKKVQNKEFISEGDPCQLKKCPSCGAELTPYDYKVSNGKLNLVCPNSECEFHTGIPVYFIDEDIYKFKPTLIVSTVDKFARMTWVKEIGQLFGIDSEYNPPELIIQDELHLISGPLGTIAGLYEMAIQKLCERDNIGAKIIASTATIRNAKNQIMSLYGKDFRQFPPQAIDIRDSYFAEEANRNDRPARKYIGVLSPGLSSSTAMIRTYANMFFGSRYLKDLGFDDEVIDNYWTLTGYFNCLRDLGGAVIQVLSDVQERYKFLCNKKFSHLAPKFTGKESYDWGDELTSRKASSEIKEILNELETKYPDKNAYDYILSSNMISVGVDISRLGLMVMTGQPKSNAEYIQASSRVGRENPGIVIVKYNPAYSRDRSHYEQFATYHSAIYKYVEATSLTPFSPRAREKALHAVYISLCRHLIDDLRANECANRFDIESSEVKEIEEYITEYVKKVDEKEYESVIDEVENIADIWDYFREDNLVYRKIGGNNQKSLLIDEKESENGFPTLNSMRNVDHQSNIYLEED